jgi:hypothetical protein
MIDDPEPEAPQLIELIEDEEEEIDRPGLCLPFGG